MYRISSLFQTLYDFYVFFQEWGCTQEGRETYIYQKEKVIEQERNLEFKLDVLYECFQNLDIFFQGDNSVYDTKQKQDLIYE